MSEKNYAKPLDTRRQTVHIKQVLCMVELIEMTPTLGRISQNVYTRN